MNSPPDRIPHPPTRAPLFRWPGKASNQEAKRWRKEIDPSMIWLIKDVAYGGILYESNYQFSGVRGVTQCLVLKEAPIRSKISIISSKAPPKEPEAQVAVADTKDLRAVASLLGQARAQSRPVGTPGVFSFTNSTMGHTHADDWLKSIIFLGWMGLERPVWLPGGVRNLIAATGTPSGDAMLQTRYRPWLSEDDKGIHGDLVAFLVAFDEERRTHPGGLAIQSEQLLNVCTLFRALAVVAPERMPETTLRLVERMEACLDMSIMDTAGKRPSPTALSWEDYRAVRSACDRYALEQGVAKETASAGYGSEDRGPRRRIL